MKILDLFRRRAPKMETRAAAAGYTAEILAARESWLSGSRGLAELTASAQGCISLWEGGLSLADVSGSEILTPRVLALMARSLALRGEAVFLIGDERLVPAADWDLSTRQGEPTAYRVSISEAGGGTQRTVLAGEVLHVRIGADPAAPWAGQAPLRRASLTAALLNALETALGEVFETAPLGSQVVPFPEAPETDREKLGRDFRGRRGRVLLRETVNVAAAGGPAPLQDWRPSDLSPDLERSTARETLDGARAAILGAFGVLPAMLAPAATGPVIREGQRHLAQWTLSPIARLIAEEASTKLGGAVALELMGPLQAYDAGGRARALKGAVDAMAEAKEAGLSQAALEAAARFAGVPTE
jgi:hypothetical protein